jgi:hypothetical protein
MITLFDVIAYLALPLIGAMVGWGLGNACLGWTGGTAGALIGLALFGYIGAAGKRAFLIFVMRRMKNRMTPLSTDELRSQISTSFTPNVILLELKSRGEDISSDLDKILELLEDSESHRRIRGWAALKSAFPQIAASLGDYRIHGSTNECRAAVSKVRLSLRPH